MRLREILVEPQQSRALAQVAAARVGLRPLEVFDVICGQRETAAWREPDGGEKSRAEPFRSLAAAVTAMTWSSRQPLSAMFNRSLSTFCSFGSIARTRQPLAAGGATARPICTNVESKTTRGRPLKEYIAEIGRVKIQVRTTRSTLWLVRVDALRLLAKEGREAARWIFSGGRACSQKVPLWRDAAVRRDQTIADEAVDGGGLVKRERRAALARRLWRRAKGMQSTLWHVAKLEGAHASANLYYKPQQPRDALAFGFIFDPRACHSSSDLSDHLTSVPLPLLPLLPRSASLIRKAARISRSKWC